MSIRIFVDDVPNKDGKYMVLQQDSETGEPFGVKDFDTKEEAQIIAEDMQRAIDNALSEKPTGELPDIPIGESSNTADESQFKDTLQDLKDKTSEETADNLQDVPVGELSNTADESEFRDSPQDLKDTTSQE